jgi:antitoxin HigA-1
MNEHDIAGGDCALSGAMAMPKTSKSLTITETITRDDARARRQSPPVHPGEILAEEFIKPLGLNMHQLALALRVPANRVGQIVDGERGITAETALRLARYFGTSAEFWMNLQKRYELEEARYRIEQKIEREVLPRDGATSNGRKSRTA